VLLYNIPQCTHTPLAHEMVTALASEPRILGVKDSWGDLSYFQSLLTLKLARPAFRVLQGVEQASMASLLLGADGLIPGLGNIAPRLMVDLVLAAHAGDVPTCQTLHGQIVDLAGVYAQKGGLAGLYAACASLGLGKCLPAEPWIAADGDDVAAIDAILEAHHLLSMAART